MQYVKTIILSFITVFVSISNVQALSCSNSEVKDLNSIASYVNVSYEVIDRGIKKELISGDSVKNYTQVKYSFEISIYNITKDIFVRIKDDVSNNTVTVNYKNTNDGRYIITNDDFGRIYKYTIEVLSTNSKCYGQKIRTITLIKPKYNAYSEYTYCNNSSSFYCQKFVEKNTNIKDDNDFLNKIKVNNDKNALDNTDSNSKDNNMLSLFKKNLVLYLSALLIVITITILVIIIVNKRNNKKGWRL